MLQDNDMTIYIIIVEDSVSVYVEPKSGTNAKKMTTAATTIY